MKTSLPLICMIFLFGTGAIAQDIEPRRWATLPLKTNFIGVGYGYTNGKIFFDPVLDVENASVDVNNIIMEYVRPFSIGKKLARVDVRVPYSIAKWEGILAGNPTTVKRNGFSDPRLRLSVNILGPSAMELKEMQEYLKAHPVYTVVGASISVTFPLGQYYNDKLLNLGQNRFVFRPQAGFVHTWRNWSYEITASLYLFTNNNDFFNGGARKQDPVFAVQTHLIRRFNHGIWGSLSLGSGLLGESLVNNQPNRDKREDVLGALSLGMPITKKQALKAVYQRSQTLNDIGGDTNTYAIIWSLAF